MTSLLEKSLRLALLGGATLLFAACPPVPDKEFDTGPGDDDDDAGDDDDDDGDADTDADSDSDSDSDADSDTDADSDSDSDADTDSDADADTGLAAMYYTGDFTGGDEPSGHFGLSLYGILQEDWVCQAEGAIDYDGSAPSGCPDCEWAFSGTALYDTIGDGSDCDDFGLTDGSLDGYFAYPWGYSAAYEYLYGSYVLNFETNVFLYIDEWFLFAGNLPDYGSYQTSGDASYVEFARGAYDSSGNIAYYYYYP